MMISEVSKLYNMPIDTIRYYEKIGLMEAVEKNARGYRVYKEKDLRRLRFLKLMRSAGVTIERLKDYVDLFYIGEDTLAKRKQILIEQRHDLHLHICELQNVLNALDYNIDHFEETLAKWEMMKRHPERYTEEEILNAEKERFINLFDLEV